MSEFFKNTKIIPSIDARNKIIVNSKNEQDTVSVDYTGSLASVFKAIEQFKYETAGKHGHGFFLAIHPEIIEMEKDKLELINRLEMI